MAIDQDQIEIEQQIERCRRLVTQTTDYELRHALEQLAQEYEAQLPKRADSFMLGRSKRDS